ncbi:hypothetical protein TRFO_18441 [Tritrichomonas foetus]|uniref:Uncharacterized protein n=1 Tax=Tritrichomonas foetus TaxID=1144522 RepID=A0A1J4KKW9_9EUKA|nr:hypothetical protein TRFO_18441 [Tritrichomonas foetus]|eukprot:OHT11953.1 hypothetical protein TRFO_18441 [Tritrichomonas foetus]
MAKLEKQQISFETESDIYDEIKGLVDQINRENSQDSKEGSYIFGVNSMFALFEESYAKNVKLLEKCQEMNAQVIINASKIQTILDVTDKDKNTMKTLKNEFDEASKMVTFAHTAETKAKDLLDSLRDKVSQLAEQVQRGEAFSFGEEGSVFETAQDVKNLTKERDNAIKEIGDLQAQINSTKLKVKGLTEDISNYKTEVERLNISLTNLEKQNNELTTFNEENFDAVMKIKPEIMKQKKDIENLTKQKNEMIRTKNQKKQIHYDVLSNLGVLRDESKLLKDKISKRARYHNELRTSVFNKEENVADIKKKIDERCNEIEKLKNELKSTQKLSEDFRAKYDEIVQTSKELSEKKLQSRQVVRQLRSNLVNLQFSLAKSDNETSQQIRHITTTKIDLSIQKKHGQEAVKQKEEIMNQAVTLKSETKGTKYRLQLMKEKILNLFQEIDLKRSEKYQMLAKIQMTKDSIVITNDQNLQHLEVLKEYERKTQDQIHLIDITREERNNSKRQYESIMKEFHELKTEYDQLMSEYNEMENHNLDLKAWTINTHFQNMDSKSQILSLAVLVDKCKKGIQETDRITSRLQAEGQTLNFILTQSQHDRLQQQQEKQLLENNIRLVRNEVTTKLKKLDQIRSQIQTDEAFIKKCSKLFNDKTNELINSMQELKQLEKKTHELEAKREKMESLEYEMHRTFAEGMVEQQKCTALIHEFSIPRNVHRWHALGAVDPNYVKQLKYRSQISSKIEKAHCELNDLRKERDDLKAQLEKLNTQINGALSAAQVQNYINQYIEDIKQKDIQLRELRKVVNGNKPTLQKDVNNLNGIRSKVTERRGTTASLAVRAKQVVREQKGDINQPYFITEAPIYNVLGGGFVSKPEQPRNQNNSFSNNTDLTIGTIDSPSNAKRALSSLISPTRKITRPLKTSHSRAHSRIQPQFP